MKQNWLLYPMVVMGALLIGLLSMTPHANSSLMADVAEAGQPTSTPKLNVDEIAKSGDVMRQNERENTEGTVLPEASEDASASSDYVTSQETAAGTGETLANVEVEAFYDHYNDEPDNPAQTEYMDNSGVYTLETVNLAKAEEIETSALRISDKTIQRVGLSASLPLSLSEANFSGACAASAPTLLNPAEGAISNDLETPRYSWTVVPGITEYLFQLALDSEFTQLLTSEDEFTSEQATQVNFTSFYYLKPETTYFWRVASVCADGQIGIFSEPSSFQTGTGAVNVECILPPPTLLEPVDGTQMDTLVPSTIWAARPDASEYKYELALDAKFTNLRRSINLIGFDTELSVPISMTPFDNLRPDTLYYWRVASVCAEIDTVGEFSVPFSFRSGASGGTFLPPPNLVAPEDGATTGSIRVTVEYTAVPDAAMYQIEFYRSLEDAEKGYSFRSSISWDVFRTGVFNPEEKVYWRVKTRNDYGWGELSEIRSFTTPVVNATTTISPQTGGTLNPDPGYLTVEFPPNAVDSETTLDFRLLAAPQQRLPNFRFANRAFVLEAFASGEQINTFREPFTMVIEYDENDLLAEGINDPTQLNVVFWNSEQWQAILPCEGCSVDTTNQTVTVVLDHLTEFALVAPNSHENLLFLPVVQR